MASNPVILTRVRVPQRRKEILRRPRLLDALHRNIYRKLTFISAPAGYGKTALLIDFAADLETAVCWYSISSDHTDLVTFVQYLVVALQQQFPKFGKKLVASMQSGVPDPYGLAVAMSNEMMVEVTDFCLVILDDFHLVGEVQGIVSFVEALIENLPEQVRFIAASRSVYGVPTVTLYLHEDLLTLGVKELRFRAEELQVLVRQNYRMSLPAEQANQLAELTDGWIIALLLALRALADGEMPRLEGHTDRLYAFLADEVLARQPKHLQQFLIATSIFDEFNEEACNQVLDVENAPALLQELSERNLFVVQIETNTGPGYQYHQLFLEFLRDRLWKQSPEWARQLHERAAIWFSGRDNWEQTVQHLWMADRYRDAAICMDGVVTSLYINGRIGLLQIWNERLAQYPNLIESAPRLALYYAKSLIDRGLSPDESERLLVLAERLLRSHGDADQIANVLLTLSVFRRQQGLDKEALSLAQEAESLLEVKSGYRWLQTQRMQGRALTSLGQLEAAIEYLQRAADGFRVLEANHDLVATLDDLTYTYWELGNIFETQNCATESLQILRKQGGVRIANSLNTLGYVLYQVGRYKEAWQLYQEALPIAQKNKLNTVLAHLMNSHGDLWRDLEEWQLAEDSYNLAQSIAAPLNLGDALVSTYAGLANLERLRGNFNEAFHWLREATRYRNETLESSIYQLSIGNIYLAMGQPQLAELALHKALSHWNKNARLRPEQALAEFLLAQSYFEVDKKPEALAWLKLALEHTALLGYDQFLVVAARQTRPLINYASIIWPNQSQLRSLLQRVEQFPIGLVSLESQTIAVEPQRAHRFEAAAFGSGSVRRDGDLISTAAWKSGRSRALFFFICDQGQVTKEQIALAFWPDFSPEKVTSNFHATLWRVRNAVGQEALVFAADVYMLSANNSLWYDVAEFESFAKQAAKATLTLEERIESWRQAITLYRGPFLDGIDLDWIGERRQTLEGTYRTGLAQIAKWELERRRLGEARRWYEQLVQLDPYYDEAQAGLINCHIQAGSMVEARTIYSTYKKRLAADLGTIPSVLLRELAARYGLR